MTEENPISIRIDGDNLYANASLLGVVSINAGNNIELDNNGSVISLVSDPSMTSLSVRGDISANTATFHDAVEMKNECTMSSAFISTGTNRFIGDVSFTGDISANNATFSGAVDLTGTLKVAPYTDAIVELGRTQIGGLSEQAVFQHKSSPNYAIKQTGAGTTTLNSGSSLYLATNETVYTTFIEDTDKCNMAMSANKNAVAQLGFAEVGYNGVDASNAVFAQTSNMNGTDYAIKQDLDGKTTLNSKDGQNISFSINNSEKMYIEKITENTGKLHVMGDIEADGSVISSDGNPLSSDGRIKKNEVYIEKAMDTLSKLIPHTYNKYKDFDCSGTYMKESGLIAQEIYYNAPELRHIVYIPTDSEGNTVTPDDNDGDYSTWGDKKVGVYYNQLIPWTIKALQEQQATIDKQQGMIDHLMSRVSALKL